MSASGLPGLSLSTCVFVVQGLTIDDEVRPGCAVVHYSLGSAAVAASMPQLRVLDPQLPTRLSSLSGTEGQTGCSIATSLTRYTKRQETFSQGCS